MSAEQERTDLASVLMTRDEGQSNGYPASFFHNNDTCWHLHFSMSSMKRLVMNKGHSHFFLQWNGLCSASLPCFPFARSCGCSLAIAPHAANYTRSYELLGRSKIANRFHFKLCSQTMCILVVMVKTSHPIVLLQVLLGSIVGIWKQPFYSLLPLCTAIEVTREYTETQGTWNHTVLDNECSSNDAFNPIGMQEVTIQFENGMHFTLLQSTWSLSTRNDTGTDVTGLVVWGPSVALSQYLIQSQSLVQSKKVLELGCGAALPSLVAHQLGASQVVATDFRLPTLEHVQYHAQINKNSPIHVEAIDWRDFETLPEFQPDVILAADVIYGIALVEPLVETIQNILPKYGVLILATRDGRSGIAEFQSAMREQFREEIVESARNQSYLPPMPKAFANDILSKDRWTGNHSIYTYRWRTNV